MQPLIEGPSALLEKPNFEPALSDIGESSVITENIEDERKPGLAGRSSISFSPAPPDGSCRFIISKIDPIPRSVKLNDYFAWLACVHHLS